MHLTGPHEWYPSVLDYTHPSGDGEPPWSNDPDERSAFDPNFDEFGEYTQRAIQTLSILDDSSSTLTPCPTLMTNQHVVRAYQHDVSHEAPDYEKFRPYCGWVNVDTVQKTMEQSTQWGVTLPNTVITLEDIIRRRGATDKLLRDSAKTEISNKLMDILRAYYISNWHSEPYHQNQNPAECRYRTINPGPIQS